jgi:hypothetical protein
MPKQSRITFKNVIGGWEKEFRAVVTKDRYYALPGIFSEDDWTQRIGKSALERQILFIKALVAYHANKWQTINKISNFLKQQIDAIVASERKKPAFTVELLLKKTNRGRIIHLDDLNDINFGKIWYLFAYDKIIISNRRWNHLTIYQISDAVQVVQDGFDIGLNVSFDFEPGKAWHHFVNPITIICHISKRCRAILRRRFDTRLARRRRPEEEEEDDWMDDTDDPTPTHK